MTWRLHAVRFQASRRLCTAVYEKPSHSGITQCYMPPNIVELARLNPSQADRYSIYLPLRDKKLSWFCRIPGTATRRATCQAAT